ncbi:MAG: helix-turn-helix transcriptional regulator [Candidatus Electrothrix sp. GW3-4]|uniref:helix-turn-helix transcriptional regulator n=1 Tax=Candidatus Electrothrix sp. GW3-4 TaxID=3126740 RepID=UPI0030CDB428
MNRQSISSQTTIAINGPKIKELRNANSLTQLYISEVLGVTVDTVSRWENNRSPNIMLENAQKLAAIFEVTIEEISNPLPKSTEQEGGEKKGKPIWTTWVLPALLLFIFLTIVLYLIINPPHIIIQLKDEGLIIKISSSKNHWQRVPLKTAEQAPSPPHQYFDQETGPLNRLLTDVHPGRVISANKAAPSPPSA